MSIRSGPPHDMMSLLTLGLAIGAVWRSSVIHSWVLVPKDPPAGHGKCLRCEYDLSGLMLTNGVGTCPECGGNFRSPELPPPWPDPARANERLTTRLMPVRGIAALLVVCGAIALPWALTETLAGALTVFDEAGLALNLRRSFSIDTDHHPIMRSGAACAMCAAMLLSWRAPTFTWLSRILLGLLIWLGVCAWNVPSSLWVHGSPWRLTIDREAAPLIGAAAGVASVGIQLALSFAIRVLTPMCRGAVQTLTPRRAPRIAT